MLTRFVSVRAVLWSVIWLAALHLGGEQALAAKKVIFLHYWTGDMSGGINEMVNAFNAKQPGFTVLAKGFDHETFKTSIKVMLEVGNPPDLFSYWAGARVQDLVGKGYLAPIDGFWKKAGLSDRFGPAISDVCTYNGLKYVIPVTQHYVAFFYNKAVFSKLGLDAPKTWDQFKRVCSRIKARGITPIALGSREKWPAQFWFDYILLRTAGPGYRKRLMAGQAAYTDAQVVKAFALWRELIELGYFNPTPNLLDWAEASKMVYNGEAGMTLMGTWIIGMFDGQLNWRQEKDYDFFVFPLIEPEVPMTALGPIDVIVTPKAGQVDYAMTTLHYFADVEPQKAMSRGSGALAPNQEIPKTFYTDMQRRILAAIRQSRHWAFNYDLATPPEAAESGLQCFFDFLQGQESIDPILKRTDKKIKQILQ